MASNVVFNGTTYSIPAEGDFNWGPDLSAYFVDLASGTFQKSGGTFTLTGEANFGATYGLRVAYIKSQAANPSATGVVRLGNAQSISFRNNANNADLAITVNSSDEFTFGGTKILVSGSIVNADINASAAIAYSKLNLSGSILNADINASAAISLSKLAAVTASRLLVSSAGGAITPSSVTDTEAGYLSGVTSAIQTQLDGKEPSITTLSIAKGGTNNGSLAVTAGGALYTDGSKIVNVGAGTSGQVLQSNGSSAPSWSNAATSTRTMLTATSSIKTPSASAQYQALSNNSIALTAGTWRLDFNALFDSSGGTPAYTLAGVGVFGANGADNSSVPTLLSATSNLTVNSAVCTNIGLHSIIKGVTSDAEIIPGPSIVVTTTATVTVYVVTFAIFSTAANSRITAAISAQKLY